MIQTHADAEALSRAGAELFVEEARKAASARGRFAVSLSGGSTPKRVYELLAGPPFRDQVPWQQVHLFWGDERCVSSEDSRSNYRMTRLALLERVPVPKEQVHAIDGSLAPGESARQYEALLRSFFAGGAPSIDLVFLGLGGNGHTASLVLHSHVLDEKTRWVQAVNILQIKDPSGQNLAPDARLPDAVLPGLVQEVERTYEIDFSKDEAARIKTLAQALAAAARE